MEYGVNDIVFVLGTGNDAPPRPCLGIVREVYDNGLYKIGVTPWVIRKGVVFPDEILVGPETEKLILAAKGDPDAKPFKSIHKAVRANCGEMFLTFFTQLMPERNIPFAFAEIAVGTLVAITSDGSNPSKSTWGIVKRIMPDGKLDVTLGTRYFFGRDCAFVSPDQLIPVLLLDKPGRNVKKIIHKHEELLWIIMLQRLLVVPPKPLPK